MNTLSRHWQIVRAALSQEKAQGQRLFRTDEATFLPAALEIVETPVSPTARATAWALMIGLALVILWLMFGRLDIIASAPGHLIPIGDVKTVQPATAGVIHAILVQDGQHVHAGQPLVELDPTISTADAAEARKTLETAQLAVARDKAVLLALDGHGFIFAPPAGTTSDIAETSRALARYQLARIQAASAQHTADLRAATATYAEARAQFAKLDQSLPLIDQEVAAYEKLLSQGFAPKLKVIEIRRERLGVARDRDTAVETANRATAEIAASTGALGQDRAEARANLLDDLTKNDADARQAAQELIKGQQRTGLQRLLSPVDGSVTQLAVHTVGGVVEAAKPVMVIVPTGGRLLVEAKLLNRDAGFVHVGQDVAVKLDAFPFTHYGTIPGRIVEISADAVADSRLGLIYLARIALTRTSIDHDGQTVPLLPGMTTIVDIKTGRRSIASYLFSPVEQRASEAAHER